MNKTFYQVVLDNTFGAVSPMLPLTVLFVCDRWNIRIHQWANAGVTTESRYAQTYTRFADAQRGANRFLNDCPKSLRNQILDTMSVREVRMASNYVDGVHRS